VLVLMSASNGFSMQPSCGTFGYEAGAPNNRRLKF
jgi:hypothetical protein